MNYRVKAPWVLKNLLYRNLVWDIGSDAEPTVYLTFDDGPHPVATPFVLEQLKKHEAKATFFCIGNNVQQHKDIYKNIIEQGHTVGNHTHNHLNGWKNSNSDYIDNVKKAEKYINSRLFRPPYGRIRRAQANALTSGNAPYTIIMWDVLSGDFDTSISPEKCAENVLKHVAPRSIVVFHDSQKAWDRMSYALPKLLEHCTEQNWKLKAIRQ